jgi:hypothetical protein
MDISTAISVEVKTGRTTVAGNVAQWKSTWLDVQGPESFPAPVTNKDKFNFPDMDNGIPQSPLRILHLKI